jgi:hypothetical protein
MNINEKECEQAGFTLDEIKKIASISRRISKAASEARKMGICVFGGTGSGSLRFTDDENKGQLVLADLEGNFDGGDGGNCFDDGFERGES